MNRSFKQRVLRALIAGALALVPLCLVGAFVLGFRGEGIATFSLVAFAAYLVQLVVGFVATPAQLARLQPFLKLPRLRVPGNDRDQSL